MRPASVLVTVLLALAQPHWRTFSAHGVSVRYPPTWTATAVPLTAVTSPEQVLAIASFPLPDGMRGADGCEPKQALDRLPPTGAFVFGWEYGQLPGISGLRRRDFPPRPRHFRLVHFAHYECLGPSYMLRFSDAGRAFQVHVALGRRATAATHGTVLRILDSLRVSRR